MGWVQPWFGGKRERSYCQKHCVEYDREAAAQGGAIVYQISAYERDEYGFLQRRTG